MHYTLDQINRDPHLLPNITLGVVALDSCDNIVNALDQCLDFIKGKLRLHKTNQQLCLNDHRELLILLPLIIRFFMLL